MCYDAHCYLHYQLGCWVKTEKISVALDLKINKSISTYSIHYVSVRGTQRQFLENICSEDDFRRIFDHLRNGTIDHFQRIFALKRSPGIFGNLFSG